MENADHRWDFFLAHAGADTEPASTLYELLAPQAQVFLDALSLQPGDVWDTALSAAQRQSLMTVVLISARTDRAYYQREEIASAIALARDDPSKHRVVPVYLDGLTAEDSRVPYGLRLRHGLTAHGADGLASVASRLLGLLGQLTGRSFDRSPESATPAEPSERTDTRAEPLLTKETIVSRSETSIVRRGRHAVHGDVLVKDLLSIPDESLDLIWSRHYRTLLGDRLIDVGRRADGSTYEILREIQGYDLSKIVRPDNVIVGALLDDIALQVLRQLKTLHGASRPAIHRDVRPTNLILRFEPSSVPSPRGLERKASGHTAVVRLIDYDTACFLNDQQTPWGAFGFSAPEQKQGAAVLASDLFALVGTLYFLATGHTPPDSGSWPARTPPQFDAVRLGDFTELSERYGHARLLKCWSYDAPARPESAMAFLDRTRVPSTRRFQESRRIGTFVVGDDWAVELFDQHYTVTRRQRSTPTMKPAT